jgi:mannose/fructose/N-acetylgalactosamine-specific phosphotransferase system component IID
VFLNYTFVAGQAETTDLNDKLSDITHKITSLKFEVIHMMKESYVKFNVLHQETVQLESKVKALSSDMNELLRRVETQVCMYSYLLILGQMQRLYILNGM